MIPQITFATLLSIAIFLMAFNLELEKMGVSSNLGALMIVLGGTLAAALIAYPWKRLVWTARLLKKTFVSANEMDWTKKTIVALARTYRKEGIRALEKMGEKLPAGPLKTAVGLISFNYSKGEIEHILQKEVRIIHGQYEAADGILRRMTRLAVALGATGTIVSLIRAFGQISDAGALAGYAGIALLSTFYGVVFANLCLVPLSHKLRDFMDQEALRCDLILEGILDLYDQENPRAIEYKLDSLSSLSGRGSRELPEAPRRPKLVAMASSKVNAVAVSS